MSEANGRVECVCLWLIGGGSDGNFGCNYTMILSRDGNFGCNLAMVLSRDGYTRQWVNVHSS